MSEILEVLALTAGFVAGGYVGSKIGKYGGEIIGWIAGGLGGLALVSWLLSKRKGTAYTYIYEAPEVPKYNVKCYSG